jgi:hypothetical protein
VTGRVTGRADAAAGSELSGLVRSRSRPGLLWAVNDSGNASRLVGLGPDGALRADVLVVGAVNVDWEDLALGPAPGPRDALYVGDIGDNGGRRATIDVYRVPEPRAGAAAGAAAARLSLRYPDGAHDAETLLVDPRTGALVVVTKELSGRSRVYVTSRAAAGTIVTLRRVATLSLGPAGLATAGDVSADGRTIAIRTYDRAFVWRRRPGESLAAALRHEPCTAPAGLGAEGQGETLALDADGRGFVTVPEGERARLRRYAAR